MIKLIVKYFRYMYQRKRWTDLFAASLLVLAVLAGLIKFILWVIAVPGEGLPLLGAFILVWAFMRVMFGTMR